MELNALDLQGILQHALEATAKGREVLLHYFGRLKQVGEKHQAGLVTEADLESERVITEFLKTKYPEFGVLGEEASYRDEVLQPEATMRWVIDPLDGTTNYVHGFHIFCISIGFEVFGKTRVAVIDAPLLGETFSATQSGGAFLNGKAIHVSQTSELNKALVATGFLADDPSVLREQIQIFAKVLPQVRAMRRPGAAAYDLCMVAAGRFDAFWEQDLKPWDTSAGSLLVREAGGQVTDYNGNDYVSSHRSLLATNGQLHANLQSVIVATADPS